MAAERKKISKCKQPMQPIVSISGVTRFHENALVRFLLDWATNKGMSLNELAVMKFSDEDRCQFAQLIGYSISGYGELNYVNNQAWNEAQAAASEAGQ